jgi:hypothetical protein
MFGLPGVFSAFGAPDANFLRFSGFVKTFTGQPA